MYYYLDQEDGYAKGPYSWEELKRLPIPAETHIYNQQREQWNTLQGYIQQMAAEAKAAVKPLNWKPTKQPMAEFFEPEISPAAKTQTTSRPRARRQTAAAPAPSYDTRQPFPPFQPGQETENPMGISGKGCFMVALFIAVILGLLFIFFL